MKQFLASLIFAMVLSLGLAVGGQTRVSIAPQQDAIAGYTVMDHPCFASGLDLFNEAEGRETSQDPSRHPFPFPWKSSLISPFTEKYPELLKKSEISNYIYAAECHVVRFEGPGIIHPFNYFW